MRRVFVGVLVVCALASSAFGQKKMSNADDFQSLINRYYAAWSTLNPDNAADFYAKDADAVFFDVAPLKYTGWAQYSDTFKKTLAPTFSSLAFVPNNDLKVTRKGDIAWTTVTFHLTAMQKDGNKTEFDGRHTAIWEKRNGKWLIVHEHVSKPL